MFRIISRRADAGINGTINDLADRADYYRRRCLDAEERIAKALELISVTPQGAESLRDVLTQTAFWEGLPQQTATVDNPAPTSGSDVV
ncbi:hypothetical protein ACWERV_23240 [Streptomyces sp. NPDC004031]